MTILRKIPQVVYQPEKTTVETQRVWIPAIPGKPAHCTTSYSSDPRNTDVLYSSCGGQVPIPPGEDYETNESIVVESNRGESTVTGQPEICTPVGTVSGAGIIIPSNGINRAPPNTTPVKTCFPAIPATPGRYETRETVTTIPAHTFVSENPGWNSSAFSIPSLEGAGYATFQVGLEVGVIVGLTGNEWENVAWNNFITGIYVYEVPDDGVYYRVIRDGQFVTLAQPIDLTSFVHIERRNGYMYIHITPTDTFEPEAATQIYEDKSRTVNGALKLDAALYLSNDEVIDASIQMYGDPGVEVGVFGTTATMPMFLGTSGVSVGGVASSFIGTTAVMPVPTVESIVYRAAFMPAFQVQSVVGSDLFENNVISNGVMPAFEMESFIAAAPPFGHVGTTAVMPLFEMDFSIIGLHEINGESTMPAFVGRSGFASNPAGVQTDAFMPTFKGFSGQIIPFDLFLDGILPPIDGDGLFFEDLTELELVGELPPLFMDGVFGGFTLDGTLPNLTSNGFFNNTRIDLEGVLPELQSDFFFDNPGSFKVDEVVPLTLTAEFIFGGVTGELQLPNICSEFKFVNSSSFILDIVLPRIGNEFGLIVTESIGNGIFDLDGMLPSIIMEPFGFTLNAVVPITLTSSFQFQNGIGEVQDGRTYVMNTETGELTEYSDFSFSVIRQLFNRRYMLGTNNKLYYLNCTDDNSESVPSCVRTHNDHRVFNDRGELVPSQNLKRNYGAYFIMRTPENAGIVVETYLDEFDGDRYELSEETLRYEGQDLVRVDFYRGPTAHYWGLAMRNKGNNRLSIFGVQQLIQILDRKIYTQ